MTIYEFIMICLTFAELLLHAAQLKDKRNRKK